MPALNFLARLAPLVESGAKQQTVRKKSKRPIKAGDRLYLFTGMRTKACRRLLDTECTRVDRIDIDCMGMITINRRQIADPNAFARADGLADAYELASWIESNYGLPFRGVVIHWRHNVRAERPQTAAPQPE